MRKLLSSNCTSLVAHYACMCYIFMLAGVGVQLDLNVYIYTYTSAFTYVVERNSLDGSEVLNICPTRINTLILQIPGIRSYVHLYL